MPAMVQCPSCSARLNLPDSAVGKRVKCPKCGNTITPAAAAEEQPRKQPVPHDDDNRTRTPRRRNDDEGDADERPRKKLRPKKSGAPVVLLAVGGGIGLLGILAVVLFFVLDIKLGGAGKGGPEPGAGAKSPSQPDSGKPGKGEPGGVASADPAKTSAPSDGWTTAEDAIGGYSVAMPGTVRPMDLSRAGGQELQPTAYANAVRDPDKDVKVMAISLLPPAGVKLGKSADEQLAMLRVWNRKIGTLEEIAEQAAVTLGGRPGLKVVLKPIPLVANDANTPEEVRADREKEARKRTVCLVTTNGKRIVLVQMEFHDAPAADIVKRVSESFRFN
jgi:predicted Zn finger-like uncharacterized protein